MLRKALCLASVIFVATVAFAQSAAHYPLINRADLPLYPPIAHTLGLTGSVEVQVVVAKGQVADAEVESVVIGHVNGGPLNEQGRKKVGLLLSTPSVANAKSWHFQPDWSGKFSVTYVYRIVGKETALPENPTVQFEFPVVTVTARPFKPTVLYSAAP